MTATTYSTVMSLEMTASITRNPINNKRYTQGGMPGLPLAAARASRYSSRNDADANTSARTRWRAASSKDHRRKLTKLPPREVD